MSSRKKKRRNTPAAPKPRPRGAEQLLSEYVETIGVRSPAICTTLGRAQLAGGIQELGGPQQNTTCLIFDLYAARMAEKRLGERGQGSVQIVCADDFPQNPAALAAVPVQARGEAELTRDLLQSAYQLLNDGGLLLTATDNPKDQWLNEQMKRLCSKVTRIPNEHGVIYSGRRTGELKKIKRFECEFSFRSGERVLQVISRPGVFSHRRIDGGARAILKLVEFESRQRVLDLGCGSGVLALAAAAADSSHQVVAVDSHARAVDCLRRAVELNELENLTVLQDDSGEGLEQGTFDLVLTNPPYYSNYQIAAQFLDTTATVLRRGGQMLLVTKQPAWFLENLPIVFGHIEDHVVGHYHVIQAERF